MRLIQERYSRKFSDRNSSFIYRYRAIEFDCYRFAVRNFDRNTDTGRSEAQLGIAENLPRLVEHLHLFLRVALVNEIVDLRKKIERDGMRILARRRHLFSAQYLTRLLQQLCPRRGTRAGHRLIGRNRNGTDLRQSSESGQCHHQRRRRAVGNRDDA